MKFLTGRIGQILLLLVFCISAQNAFGTHIESGSIQVFDTLTDSGVFTLSGDNFTASGEIIESALLPLGCCSVLSIDGFASGGGFGSGPATVGGTTFPQLNWANAFTGGGTGLSFSQFVVTGPDIVLSGPGTYVGSFSFAGSLCGGPPGVVINGQVPCLVDLPQLTGSGLVSVVIEAFPNGTLHEVDATYTFVAPEPSSIVFSGECRFDLLPET